MRYLYLVLLIALPIWGQSFRIQEGDLIFQELKNSDSRALKLASGTKFTHVGVILKYKGKFIVLEANGNVRRTEIVQFLKKGVNGQFLIKRFKGYKDFFTEEKYNKLRDTSSQFVGKPIDIYYGWGDEKYYASELVWKFFKEALELELCKLKKFKDLNLNHPYVKLILSQKFGKEVPLDETMVTSKDIMQSELLETVYPKLNEDDEFYPLNTEENPFLKKEENSSPIQDEKE